MPYNPKPIVRLLYGAIKFLNLGASDPVGVQRFRREGKILGRLSHVHIAYRSLKHCSRIVRATETVRFWKPLSALECVGLGGT